MPIFQHQLPTIAQALDRVTDKIEQHRQEAHGGDQEGFHDCAVCGMLEHRQEGLLAHRKAGNTLVPIKGLFVDPQTGELALDRIGAEPTTDETLVSQHIAHTLKRFGFDAAAWEKPPSVR
jgi:hypothetical protein